MNGYKLLFAALVAALSTDAAIAIDDTGWCAGVTGAPVIACDDFDDYCPDPPCDDAIGDDAPDQGAFLTVWPRSDCDCKHSPVNGGADVNALIIGESVCEDPCTWGARPCPGTEYCGVSEPFSLRQTGSQYGNEDYPDARPHKYLYYGTSHRHDLVPQIEQLDPAKGSVDGTDDDPLVLEFAMDVWGDAYHRYGAAMVNRYIELTDGSDRAPAEVTITNCVGLEKMRPQVARGTAVDGEYHNSIAIGIFAVIDEEVCGGDGESIKPLTYHLALYDGDRWIELEANVLGIGNPSGPAGMLTGGHLNYITMTIKSSTIELELQSKNEQSVPPYTGTYISTATAPRMYTGRFSAMHVGNGACLPSKDDEYVDNIALTGGVLEPPIPTGACCLVDSCVEDTTLAGCESRLGGAYEDGLDCATANCPMPPGACCVNEPTAEGDFCEDGISQDTCENTLGGIFNGNYSTCDHPYITCCPDPFADSDGDGDVDQDDFATLQACISGVGGVAAGCECFNHDGDSDVDQDDWEAFEECASGPDVPADETCDDPI